MALINITKRKKLIITVIAGFLIFLGYYLAVYKSFSYQSSNDTIGNVMMIISVSLFPMLWLDINENSKWKKYVYVAPTVIFSIAIIIGLNIKKKNYLEEELNKYGTYTIGKVTGFEIEHHRRSQTDYATLEYYFENKQFIQRIETFDDEYILNQDLNIKISKRNPEMFEIIKTEK